MLKQVGIREVAIHEEPIFAECCDLCLKQIKNTDYTYGRIGGNEDGQFSLCNSCSVNLYKHFISINPNFLCEEE